MKSIMKYALCTIFTVCLILPISITTASELVWTPINPSFGGSYLNGSWLLASAEAQYKEPVKTFETDPMVDFQKRIENQALFNLADDLISVVYGDEDYHSVFGEGEETTIPIGKYEAFLSTKQVKPGGIYIKLSDTTDLNRVFSFTIEPY